MSSLLDRMSALERAARRQWLLNAVRTKFGICGACGANVFVARQSRRSDFECLDCWDGRQ